MMNALKLAGIVLIVMLVTVFVMQNDGYSQVKYFSYNGSVSVVKLVLLSSGVGFILGALTGFLFLAFKGGRSQNKTEPAQQHEYKPVITRKP